MDFLKGSTRADGMEFESEPCDAISQVVDFLIGEISGSHCSRLKRTYSIPRFLASASASSRGIRSSWIDIPSLNRYLSALGLGLRRQDLRKEVPGRCVEVEGVNS